MHQGASWTSVECSMPSRQPASIAASSRVKRTMLRQRSIEAGKSRQRSEWGIASLAALMVLLGALIGVVGSAATTMLTTSAEDARSLNEFARDKRQEAYTAILANQSEYLLAVTDWQNAVEDPSLIEVPLNEDAILASGEASNLVAFNMQLFGSDAAIEKMDKLTVATIELENYRTSVLNLLSANGRDRSEWSDEVQRDYSDLQIQGFRIYENVAQVLNEFIDQARDDIGTSGI